ncbi:MAG: oligosaccharide flippase family protein [Candidatus Kuenenia sp.]|nr:oligosaccharide flippase family protein [Candidatus Kuenenia hertensis]
MKTPQQAISEDTAKDVKKFAKGASFSFIGSVIGRVIWFISQVITARFLGTEVFGLFILGLLVVKISSQIARTGLNAGALRFVSMYRNEDIKRTKGVLINSFSISFFNGILLGAITYFSSDFISESIFHKPHLSEIAKTFAFSIPFLSTLHVVAFASRGFQTTKYSVYIVEIIQPSLNLLLIIAAIYLDFGILGIICAYIVSHGIALLAGYYFIAKQFPEIKSKTIKPVYEVRKLLNYSSPLLLSGFLMFLLSWVDTLMLGFMRTSADVGIYRAASQIPIFLLLVSRASNSIYAPAIAELYYQDKKDRLQNLLKTSTRWIFFFTLPLTLILIFSPKEILSVFGKEYTEAGSLVLIILALSQFVNCVTGGVGMNLSICGKQNLELFNNIAMFVVNVILNYFLISTYGAVGAAFATAISIASINIIRLFQVYIVFKIHPYNASYIAGIISGIITFFLLYYYGHHLPYKSYATSLAAKSLGVGLVFAITFLITGLKEEDKVLFSSIKNKFKLKSSLVKA